MEYSSLSPRPASTRLLARDVERIILKRIADGRYGVGARLPSCKDFGREIGANKNTVSKAYRALAEGGYISVTAGRGAFVTVRPPAVDEAAFVTEIEPLLDLVAHQAYAAGISLDDLERLAGREMRRRYDHVHVRIGFVECNSTEAETFTRELEEAIGAEVEPLLLADVLTGKKTAAQLQQFDVIAVSLAHLAEVEQRLGSSGLNVEIVPLPTLPAPARLVEVARLAPGTRLGVVAETPEALNALTSFVQAFNPLLHVEAALTGEARLDKVIGGADMLLVTEIAHRRRLPEFAEKPVIDAPFELDRRSVELLAERVAERRRVALSTPSSQLHSVS
jgi:DNA-binding transcriptional regulator YhcF (GntR family)/ADP-ribose pyrophosphatase YjhB (NUDIX family)